MRQFFTYLPTDHIVEEESSEFTPLAGNDFLKLFNSIKEAGILQPLIVYPSNNGDNRYIIHAGYNRLRAARELGLKEVPCLVVEDRTNAVNVRYDTDLYRRHLQKEDIEKYEKKKEGKIEAHLKRIFIPEIVEMYKSGILSLEQLGVISTLSHEDQRKLLDASNKIKMQEQIDRYESEISSLTRRIQELEENQVPLEKLQKDIQKKLKEKEDEIEKRIREAYSSESQERVKEIIEAERARIEKEYKREMDEVMAELREMSRAKAKAQEQIDVLQEEVKRLKEREKEYELIHERAKHDLEIAKKTIETAVSPEIIKEKIDIAARDLLRIYNSMILIGRDGFSDKESRELKKVSEQLVELVTEIASFW
jgi:ParB family chromosome partitioning protein